MYMYVMCTFAPLSSSPPPPLPLSTSLLPSTTLLDSPLLHPLLEALSNSEIPRLLFPAARIPCTTAVACVHKLVVVTVSLVHSTLHTDPWQSKQTVFQVSELYFVCLTSSPTSLLSPHTSQMSHSMQLTWMGIVCVIDVALQVAG